MMRVKDKLRALAVTPSKGRGQNFIIDPFVVQTIAAFGNPGLRDKIIEIGPGLGALTKELAPYDRLVLVELEERFCVELKKQFPEAELINADIRTVDLSQFGNNLVVFGNLPYSFSTDIVFHLLAHRSAITRAILLLQKEFVERMAAAPGSRIYGALSVACQLWATVRPGPIVPGASFHPPANVDSQVVELGLQTRPRYEVADPFILSRVVQAAFTRRRKMIKNSLRASKQYPPERIDEALVKAGIGPERRPEMLSIEEFARLAEALESVEKRAG
jgi:16S rRNA (adenine1518-N6/adenine1519-N6)-dimethyltransferase